MAQPSTRQELIDYCKRQLGYPVLEINVADEQIDDLVDDAIQYFQERHLTRIRAYYKYKITQADIDRGRTRGGNNPVGIATEQLQVLLELLLPSHTKKIAILTSSSKRNWSY